MPVTGKSGFRISSQVLSQEVSGETVLLDLRSEQYFGLDPVGTRVWQMLEKGLDLDEMYANLLAEYEVSGDQLKHDVEALLQELIRAGLVSSQDSA